MTISRRMMIITALTLTLSGTAMAQETTATTAAKTASAASTAKPVDPEESSATRQNVRHDFSQLLARHPEDMTRVIVLDPALLTNEPFLARYPELAQFLTEHPEIRRNPHYYLEDVEFVRQPFRQRTAFAEIAEMLSMMFVAVLIAFALVWLVRTMIEQKRWSQLSRRQSEVHNKILDRLGASEELLAYVKSPAGTKYLESAPIALHAAPSAPRTPLQRMMWSIQIGIVAAAAGLGLLLVSMRSTGDAEQGFFAMGAVTFCIGAGFIVSAFVSIVISRRLGIGQENDGGVPGSVANDPGLMR